jgi:CheY-like chemotaxis protein
MKRRLTSLAEHAKQWLMRSIGSRLTASRHRFRVWLVDDREQNRTDFYDAQKHHFDIETFSTTGELLDALRSGAPDALLCDIYFYEDPVQREQIEQWVQGHASKLREEASTIAPDTAQRGIRLIGDIHKQFRGSPPFPIYAYTSKGPYLLQGDGFQRLEELEARWLFKGRLDPSHVRHRLDTDIREFRDQFNLRKWIWQGAIRAGFLGAVFGILVDRLLKYLFQW